MGIGGQRFPQRLVCQTTVQDKATRRLGKRSTQISVPRHPAIPKVWVMQANVRLATNRIVTDCGNRGRTHHHGQGTRPVPREFVTKIVFPHQSRESSKLRERNHGD